MENNLLNKKILLLLMIFIVLPMTLAYIYVEDSTNQACVGVFEGANPCANAYDGDYGTHGDPDAGTVHILENFTLPGYVIGGLLQSKGGAGATFNDTMPALCANQTPIQFNWTAVNAAGSDVYCWNTTNWHQLHHYGAGENMYELAVFYNFSGIMFEAYNYYTNASINNFSVTVKPNWVCGSPPCSFGADYNVSGTTKSTTSGSVWFNITDADGLNMAFTSIKYWNITGTSNKTYANIVLNESDTHKGYIVPYTNLTIYVYDRMDNSTITNFTSILNGTYSDSQNSLNNITYHFMPAGTYQITIDASNTDSDYYLSYQNITLNATTQNTTIYVNKIVLDNCSSYNVTAINFTVYNQTSGLPLLSTMEGYFLVTANGQTRNFSIY